jgi:hypothetical protein
MTVSVVLKAITTVAGTTPTLPVTAAVFVAVRPVGVVSDVASAIEPVLETPNSSSLPLKPIGSPPPLSSSPPNSRRDALRLFT